VTVDGYPRGVRGLLFGLLIAAVIWAAIGLGLWWWLG
jgi:hypothetical protein